MNITDVRVRLFKKDDGKLKGVASIVIDNDFVVHDIKIIDNDEGPFIVMPSRKAPDGIFRDIAHPLRTEVRDMLRELIITEYEKERALNQ
ncbi:MAG: septation regulator SpoVG [Firmicutes bacterium]|nr:septation regulator SpoVG [Bacillota bacterium]